MKHLLRVLFILALFCGVTGHARAAGVDFHAQILDPTCEDMNSACTLNEVDLGVGFPITFSASNCAAHGITGPMDLPFGCFVGTNQTGGPITTFSLDFTGAILAGATCDTDLSNTGITVPMGQGPAFSVSGCTPDGSGGFDLAFSGGTILDTNQFVILEVGIAPGPDNGLGAAGTADPTPEPDSLLLFSTGALMMTAGLYVKQRRYALGKK
jgi:hypothetical protein